MIESAPAGFAQEPYCSAASPFRALPPSFPRRACPRQSEGRESGSFGVYRGGVWIPAFAGMTDTDLDSDTLCKAASTHTDPPTVCRR
jgi:hypothetical protein